MFFKPQLMYRHLHRDDFQLFFSAIRFPKVAGHVQNRLKNDHFEWGVDGFRYFSLISVITFSNQDHPF
jgi:hypothetical protein